MTTNRAAVPDANSDPQSVLGQVRVPSPGATRTLYSEESLPVGRRIVRRLRRSASPPDWVLVGSVLALVFIGLIFVFSSSFAISQELHGNTRYFAIRQLIGAGIGLAAFVLLARIDYRIWQRFSSPIIWISLLLLAAVLIPGIGHEENGATRWIQIGSLPALQPSEFAKLAICIYVAAWLAAKGDEIKRIPLGLAPFCLIIGVIGGLLMLEPDLGTFAAIAATGVVMFFLAGAAMKHMFMLLVGGSAVLFAIVVGAGYGMERIRTFFNAEEVAQEAGFQIINLVSTLGSGVASPASDLAPPARSSSTCLQPTPTASSPSSAKRPACSAR